MSRFNHGVEFQSLNTQRVSFSDVEVADTSDRNDSLDEERSSSFTQHQNLQRRKSTNLTRRICCGTIVVIVVTIAFITLLMISSRNYPDNNYTARLPFHNHHRTIAERCNASDYGCCEVYNLCHVHEDNNMTYIHKRIWPSVQIKHNEIGSNCPRMNRIVDKYNTYNYPFSPDNNFICMNSTYGCCSIDIACDLYVYFGINMVHNKNNSLYEPGTLRYMNHRKEDSLGTNCPSFNHIVLAYNNGFNDVLDDMALLIIVIVIIACLYGLSQK